MYKQQPKSPVLKALKGNQGKLPQHLQDAIKAAPGKMMKNTPANMKVESVMKMGMATPNK